MQKVFLRSTVTYEWIQVTPSRALTATTPRQKRAPTSFWGMATPPGKVRSIT